MRVSAASCKHTGGPMPARAIAAALLSTALLVAAALAAGPFSVTPDQTRDGTNAAPEFREICPGSFCRIRL